jgi:hypothetical protein
MKVTWTLTLLSTTRKGIGTMTSLSASSAFFYSNKNTKQGIIEISALGTEMSNL